MTHKSEEKPIQAPFSDRSKTPAKVMPRECPVKAKVVEKLLKEKK